MNLRVASTYAAFAISYDCPLCSESALCSVLGDSAVERSMEWAFNSQD